MSQNQPEGYLAMPATGKGSGVLVLHAWWGLNDTIKAFCKRLADSGFVVFAPDLYHGKVAKTIPEAETLGKALDANHAQAKAEVAEAAKFVKEKVGESGIAVIGFSLGAYYAVNLSLTAPETVSSVILFYGSGDGDFSKSKASYLIHFADNDEYEPKHYGEEMERTLKAAGRPATFYTYPDTKHWFFEPDRVQEYNPPAANLAWERTVAFLNRSPGE